MDSTRPEKWYSPLPKAVNPKERYIYVRPRDCTRLTRRQWQELVSYQATPLDIVIAKLDKKCPKCNATTSPTRVKFNGNGEPFVMKGDFDIGKENGRVFGARCMWCGWSFYEQQEPY